MSADHYRVGGALPRLYGDGLSGNWCQPIITASGGAHVARFVPARVDVGVSRSLPRRGALGGLHRRRGRVVGCQPIITASGALCEIERAQLHRRRVSADHYRVGGALAHRYRPPSRCVRVSADHYRVGGRLRRSLHIQAHETFVSADHYRVGGASAALAKTGLGGIYMPSNEHGRN